jgi:hypothetical protein
LGILGTRLVTLDCLKIVRHNLDTQPQTKKRSHMNLNIRVENPTHKADTKEFGSLQKAYDYAIELIEYGFSPKITVLGSDGECVDITIDDLKWKLYY